jgi:hypothetical protein
MRAPTAAKPGRLPRPKVRGVRPLRTADGRLLVERRLGRDAHQTRRHRSRRLPGLREKFRNAIQALVAAAEDAINKLADLLKEAVVALLDAWGKAVDLLLMASAAVVVLDFVANFLLAKLGSVLKALGPSQGREPASAAAARCGDRASVLATRPEKLSRRPRSRASPR